MKLKKYGRIFAVMTCLLCVLNVSGTADGSENASNGTNSASLWSHDNLFAWCVVPFDAAKRGPEARAQMLEHLGFKQFAYDWREKDIPTFDEELEALQKHNINLLGWWFPLGASAPGAKATLEVFKRHKVHPQLWVAQSFADFPKTPEEWTKLLPKGIAMPRSEEESDKLSESDQANLQKEMRKVVVRLYGESFTKTPQEQERRVRQEADRINALVKLAAPYGSKVELYNHDGWFGMTNNQIAIIERLKELGATDVGLVYNFSHARDSFHDDTKNFPALWKKIQPYVVAVNISGMRTDGDIIYPSQGDSELSMMRTIQQSGWRGPIGLIAEKGGDAENTLKNYLVGLDWLATELKQPGSGGPQPFSSVR